MEDHTLQPRGFAYRRNEDGSVDSICLGCFRTVGSALLAVELQEFERNHHCEPWAAGSLLLRTELGSISQ